MQKSFTILTVNFYNILPENLASHYIQLFSSVLNSCLTRASDFNYVLALVSVLNKVLFIYLFIFESSISVDFNHLFNHFIFSTKTASL